MSVADDVGKGLRDRYSRDRTRRRALAGADGLSGDLGENRGERDGGFLPPV